MFNNNINLKKNYFTCVFRKMFITINIDTPIKKHIWLYLGLQKYNAIYKLNAKTKFE